MSECIQNPEYRYSNPKRALALLTLLALAACGQESTPYHDVPAQPAKPAGNFDIHYEGYEDPMVVNCWRGPYVRRATFEGKIPKAYVFLVNGEKNADPQGMRLKVLGPRSDLQVAYLHGNPNDTGFPEPAPGETTVIPLEPEAEVLVRGVAQKPYRMDIELHCS